MIVSGAAPLMVDALRRVRRFMSRRVFCRFCHARSRLPIVFGPFHYCAFCERAAPDALETIDDQRRCTRMSLSDTLRRLAWERIPTAPAKWLGPSEPGCQLYNHDFALGTNGDHSWSSHQPLFCYGVLRYHHASLAKKSSKMNL